MENRVKVSGVFTKQINFAMQQNYVPIIRNLVVTNGTEETLEQLQVNISFAPEFAHPYQYTISEIKASESLEIPRMKIQMNTEYLFALTEKMVGSIQVRISCGEEILNLIENNIELLAYDEWSGVLMMPEIISAFIMPNHPLITKVITNAGNYLKKWAGSPSFTGYQTRNPENVKFQMAAIYSALQEEEIIYNNPPASYEVIGQRVRLPHRVLEQKMGTCLDLTVLYATCLEAVGLHPLVCFVKGHAFGGCWLEEDTFADSVMDDVSAITKRLATGAMDILLVECVDFVSGQGIDFDNATRHGENHMIAMDTFFCAIDVKRTRSSGIRPMPIKLGNSYQSGNALDANIETGYKQAVEKPESLNNSLSGIVLAEDKPMTKQKIWERKLLDFSLRNTLLNFRVTKNAFQILSADLAELEDRLSDGKEFRIMEAPAEFTASLRDMKMYEIETEKNLIQSIAESEFKSNRIRTFLNEDVLEKTLKSLYRNAKMSMDENGTNTLFLALGFLKWYESDVSEKPRFAPIVLIPVDIVRNRKNKGYIIRSRQEDAQINVTLLEYLKQDHNVVIGGLDPLPEDAHGIDVPLIFNTIRQGIMGKNHWTIENMTFVGLFSFGQFVMWNDIHNRSGELEKNKIVSSLIEGGLTWQPEDSSLSGGDDIEVALADMAIPVSADSSQMAAIAAAANGQSFVLHGPPGTGKSQTITNMIANALYQGKSVLFVAEKMAALNVVQKRLADIGLAPFTLELHSNKTNKSTVLASLSRSLEVGKIKSPEDYKEFGEKVHTLRSRLNDVMDALHCQRNYGCSLYKAIAYFEKNREYKGKVLFAKSVVESLDKYAVEQWRAWIHEYELAVQEIGVYATHPLSTYKGTSYSIEIRESFLSDLAHLLQQYESVNQSIQKICHWAGEEKQGKQEITILMEIVEVGLLPAITLQNILISPNYDGVVAQVQQLVAKGIAYQQQVQEITGKYEDSIFDYDVTGAKLEWKQAESAWVLPKTLKQNKLVKGLKLHAKQAGLVAKESILHLYEELLAFQQLKKEILEAPASLTEQMSGMFLGLQTDWIAVAGALEKVEHLHSACKSLSEQKKKEILEKLSNLEMSQKKNILCIKQYMDSVSQLQKTYSLALEQEKTPWLDGLQEQWLQYKAHMRELHNMTRFNQIDQCLCENDLQNFSQGYKNGSLTKDEVESAFLCNLYFALTLMTIGQDLRLGDFHGKQYNDIIVQYKEIVEKYQQLTIQELVARLSANIPSSAIESAASSEMGILKKAIKNNGRMMSLRKLFDQTPILLRKLAPCMLMSPISVAQYIDPSFAKFDLVIFDEASQLPTSEAVGTIARGKNVVVVGDPKQLPPTNFFSSNRVDEENGEKEDLESLLDDCLAISMPEESLQWHYRSRHESLIAYSNMKYYDNKLYTFPSPSDLTSEVRLVPVEGFYDKGRTKHNIGEAKAVVAEIIRRLEDKTLRKDSIGVVTFSSVQQNLIDDFLTEELHKHPELEELDQNSKEPIFVKNLENVQGDERDVILFSIGYGPDATGKVSMNFGPLNRDGGWRRLNVAISRARKTMIVYSVLKPEQIDLSRTRSEGVEGLKGFLEFAARGKNIAVYQAGILQKKEDYLAKELVAAIGEMGYQAKDNVGCSEFKVDIGIINPKNPETYILGILIDGENCRKSATARDRFVLQPSVLGGLGWTVIRVWTLDWLDDPEKVKHSIQTDIQKAMALKETCAIGEEIPEEKSTVEVVFTKEEVVEESLKHMYISADVLQQGTAENFYLPASMLAIQRAIAQILEVEAPISRKALMRKTLTLWDIARVGTKVETIFMTAMKGVNAYQTMDGERVFYWTSKEQVNAFVGYRVADVNGNKRSMDDIPSQEIKSALREVLWEQMSLKESDLLREIAKKFEFFRMGSIIETTIQYTIQKTITDQQILLLTNGNLALQSDDMSK